MSEIWVFKADGTLQCTPVGEGEISLAEMREELAGLIGADNILAEEKRGPKGSVISQCGRPTGYVNAYKITESGFKTLFTGIAGPSGFQVDSTAHPSGGPTVVWPTGPDDGPILPWPAVKMAGDDRWVPWPWPFQLISSDDETSKRGLTQVISAVTSSADYPSLVKELIGRPVRVYREGDPYLTDFVQERVNIVVSPNDGKIAKIWYG